MILWVWVSHVPFCFLGIKDFPILNHHGFDVALAQIECKSISVCFLSTTFWIVLAGWQVRSRVHNLHLKSTFWSSAHIRHGLHLKLIHSTFRVHLLDCSTDLGRPAQEQRARGSLPDHLLNEHSSKITGSAGIFVRIWEHRQGIPGTTSSSGKSPFQCGLLHTPSQLPSTSSYQGQAVRT